MVHKFVPGDPEIEALKAQLARTDIADAWRCRFMVALGNAYHAIGRYDDAFAEFRRANDMNAQRTTPFDLEKRRAKVETIKRGFATANSAPNGSRASEDIVPVFVVGMSRSGKTLVEGLLGGRLEVCTMGEWLGLRRAIVAVCARHGTSAPYPDCVDELNDAMFEEIGQSYLEDLAVNFPECRYFVATWPGYYRHVGLIFRAFTAPRLIYCHRDPVWNTQVGLHCPEIFFDRVDALGSVIKLRAKGFRDVCAISVEGCQKEAVFVAEGVVDAEPVDP